MSSGSLGHWPAVELPPLLLQLAVAMQVPDLPLAVHVFTPGPPEGVGPGPSFDVADEAGRLDTPLGATSAHFKQSGSPIDSEALFFERNVSHWYFER